MAKDERVPLIVTISGDRPIHAVAKDLKEAGFNVEQVLEFAGSVTGSAHPNTLQNLRKVKGVADVSPDHSVDVGPPGAVS